MHDPNSFMYVLNSQISAVRAEEASRQVSSGLKATTPIQPLVIRAHEGDCVTVNLTNATTFGVQAMDQPPIENVGDDCDDAARLQRGAGAHRAGEHRLERRRPAGRRVGGERVQRGRHRTRTTPRHRARR